MSTRHTAATGRLRALPARLPLRAWIWLAAGFTAVTVCGVLFAELLDQEDVARIDQPVTTYVAAHRTPVLTLVFRVVTPIGSAAGLIPLTLAGAAVLAWRGRTWRSPRSR